MIRKIICFDPPYSNYFNDLAKEIEILYGKKLIKECFTFNFFNKIYLNDFSMVNPKRFNVESVDQDKYSYVNFIKSLSNIEGNCTNSSIEDANIINYTAIENYILKNKKSVFLIYNDLRWQHAFAIDVLKKNNISYFVFERGVFRPNSTTMDVKGANANSKFCSDNRFNKNKVDKFELECNKNKYFYHRKEKPVKLKFSIYFLLSSLVKVNTPLYARLSSYSKYRKTFKEYIKLYFRSNANKSNCASDEIKNYTLDKKIVFVPLQLSNDTQTLINSSFSSTQDFIWFIHKEFKSTPLSKDHVLVFKKHPMDIDEYQFPKDALLTEESTSSLIRKCRVCVTINSTVGFEALSHCDVVCYGKSFYTEHGFVKKSLAEINNISKKDVEKYLNQVINHYQVPGSIFNYTHQDIKYTADKIISKLKVI